MRTPVARVVNRVQRGPDESRAAPRRGRLIQHPPVPDRDARMDGESIGLPPHQGRAGMIIG